MSDFARARAVVAEAIAARVTPGAQLSVRWEVAGAWQSFDHAEGALSYDATASPVVIDTRYDFASVTKAIVSLAIVRAAARGSLSLDATLGDLLPDARGAPAAEATLRQLLSHRADLPAWRPFFRSVTPEEAERGASHDAIVSAAMSTALEPAHGAARYSDIGYILAGEAGSCALASSVDEIVAREVTVPLGLADVVRFRGVSAEFRTPDVAPTELCAWRHRVVQGNVHDENAYALGGTAGHAGLFGTARALAEVGRASLDALAGDARWFPTDAMRAMVAVEPGGSHRLGWDGKSAERSSAGERASAATFGHLGFTGTSLWCDPDARIVVALVTNRVHPSRENDGIRALRPRLHDAIRADLDGA